MTRAVVLALLCAALVLQVLFPPWHLIRVQGIRSLGYSPLWIAPEDGIGSVNISLLALQLAGTAAVGGLLIWIAKK